MHGDPLNFLLWKTHMIWQRKLNIILKEFNVSYSQYIILLAIYFFNEQKTKANQIELINFTDLDKMTMSKAIKKLVKDGHIKQKLDKNDLRSKGLLLNNSGLYIITQLVSAIASLEEKFFNRIEKESQQEIITSLTVALKDNLRRN